MIFLIMQDILVSTLIMNFSSCSPPALLLKMTGLFMSITFRQEDLENRLTRLWSLLNLPKQRNLRRSPFPISAKTLKMSSLKELTSGKKRGSCGNPHCSVISIALHCRSHVSLYYRALYKISCAILTLIEEWWICNCYIEETNILKAFVIVVVGARTRRGVHEQQWHNNCAIVVVLLLSSCLRWDRETGVMVEDYHISEDCPISFLPSFSFNDFITYAFADISMD